MGGRLVTVRGGAGVAEGAAAGISAAQIPVAGRPVAQPMVEAMPLTTVLANPTIDISNPAIAAAIAAYHMVDGLFDTAWPHDEGMTIAVKGYTEIWPVGEIHAVRLDLYV